MMGQHTYSQETRQFPRVEFNKTPWIFSLVLQNNRNLMDSPLQLEAINISENGMLFQSNKKIPIFSVITIHLVSKNGGVKPIVLEGKITRIDETDIGLTEKTFSMSVQFQSLTEDVKQHLAEGILSATP